MRNAVIVSCNLVIFFEEICSTLVTSRRYNFAVGALLTRLTPNGANGKPKQWSIRSQIRARHSLGVAFECL